MDLFPLGVSSAHTFTSLRSRLSEQQAIETFTGGRSRRAIRLIRHDRLRSIASVYVPYHLFRVEISDRGRRQTTSLAIDAVSGTLDLYRFADDRAELDLVCVQSRNRIAATLTAGDAWPRVADQLRRVLFQNGFFRLRDPHIAGGREPIDLHIPYWVGFYERAGRVRLSVIDAVRRRIEGAKARALFEEWLKDLR
jgi:hypothetical protein